MGSGRINILKSLTINPSPFFRVTDIQKNNIIPGRNGSIVIRLKNVFKDALGVTAALSSNSPYISIQNNLVSFGDILSGQEKTNSSPFIVAISGSTPWGTVINFTLTLSCGDYRQVIYFNVPVAMFFDLGSQANLPLNLQMPLTNLMEDYNNDGYADIFLGDVGFPRNLYLLSGSSFLYKNLKNGSFSNSNAESGIDVGSMTLSALFIDINNDGYKDLFVSSLFKLGILSGSVRNIDNHLYKNNRNGSFTDVRYPGDVFDQRQFSQEICIDYNNDGFVDVFGIINPVFLCMLKNNKNCTFTGNITATGIPSSFSGPNAFISKIISFDYNNDGLPDLLVIIQTGNGIINKLYRNNGNGTFADVSSASGLSSANDADSAAVAAGDYNNDGNIDLFLYGTLYKNNGNGLFTDVTTGAGDLVSVSHGSFSQASFFDYDNDGYLDLYVIVDKKSRLYKNNSNGSFTDVTDISFMSFLGGISPGFAAPSSIGDYDNDGALDIYVPASSFVFGGSNGAFLRNIKGTSNNWLKIKLTGTISSRDAFGARVCVNKGALKQLREVHTSQVETQPLHFGLGNSTVVDDIWVRWPKGKLQKLNNVSANQLLTVTEDPSCYAYSFSGAFKEKGWKQVPAGWWWNNGDGWAYSYNRKAWIYLNDYRLPGRGYYYIEGGWWYFFGNGCAWIQRLNYTNYTR
jgi:hypothetical protein